jgi:hypothetical protein
MTAPRRNRGWVWYFAVLALMTAASVGGLIAYNLGQQLHPQTLANARALWDQKGPRDYNLVYSKSGSATGKYVVEVRGGRVRKVTEGGRPLEPWQFSYYSMTALLDDLAQFLKMKEEPGNRQIYIKADFDPDDGHLRQYRYSNPNTRSGVEVIVEEFEPVRPEGKP